MPTPTLADTLQERARARLDPAAYDYAVTGAGIEETLAANVSAWRELYLRPRVLRDVREVDTASSLLGAPVAAPVGVAPFAYHRLFHAGGEPATAKGAAGTLFVLSSRTTASFGEVVPVCEQWWFQVYVTRDRELTAEVVRRAAAAGARALVLTVDTPYPGVKAYPADPHYGVPLPDALVPELRDLADDRVQQAADVTWPDIGWLRETSGGLPVVVKGVVRDDDARACVDAGAAAVWVSNHGARQLDGTVPTARALPEVTAAVGGDVEVYVDGGVRTGRDVLRALALGARAVFLGRPVVWALATGGTEGVASLLAAIHAEVREALALAGCRSTAEVTPDLVRWR